MKKLVIFLGLILVFMFSMSVQAGQPLGASANLDPGIARPHSSAFGQSLDEWLEAYVRWLFTGVPSSGKIGHVRLLPIPLDTDGIPEIIDDVPTWSGHLDIEVEVGTALVLPMVIWTGESYDPDTGLPDDEPLPDAWFGDIVWGDVMLDGKPILEPNAAYYVGPVYLDPPIIYDEPSDYGSISAIFFQGIACVINPLSPGEHEIDLYSTFDLRNESEYGWGVAFDNSWKITVKPKRKGKKR
jgi:hypothetical protein